MSISMESGSAHSVREYLAQMIADGRYLAGGKLPTERALAEQLSVPRSTVRNVLAVLESEGVVVRRIGSGTFVKDAEELGGLETVAHTSYGVSPAEIMDGRLLIEPRLVGLAVVNGNANDFNALESFNKKAENAETFEEFERWDAALHQGIARATHNRLIMDIYNKITEARSGADWGELKRRSINDERRKEYEEDHRRVVAALRLRDAAKAEAEMLSHLQRVRKNLLNY